MISLDFVRVLFGEVMQNLRRVVGAIVVTGDDFIVIVKVRQDGKADKLFFVSGTQVGTDAGFARPGQQIWRKVEFVIH